MWPAVRDEVERKTRHKLPAGVEPADVSNEVAVRLLAAPNGPSREIFRFWCLRVARCVVADLYRRPQVADGDLPRPATTDVEQLALARLRLGAAADALAQLPAEDRAALTSCSIPMSDATKSRRKRARQQMRERMEKLVGSGILLPRLRWLFVSGTVAAAGIPFTFGVNPYLQSAPPEPAATTQRPQVGQSMDIQVASGPKAPTTFFEPSLSNRGDGSSPGPGRTSQLSVVMDIPGVGPASAESYEPAPDEGPKPLACARHLRVVDDVCVAHPVGT